MCPISAAVCSSIVSCSVLRCNRTGLVRCRTFNRHQVKKIWHPSPRFYMVPVDCAEELGKAIIAAARGEQYGQVPGWWYDFEKQYQAEEWRRQPQAEDGEDDWSDPYAAAEGGRPVSSRPPRLPGLRRLPSLPKR